MEGRLDLQLCKYTVECCASTASNSQDDPLIPAGPGRGAGVLFQADHHILLLVPLLLTDGFALPWSLG
jgi:hypothetical protein